MTANTMNNTSINLENYYREMKGTLGYRIQREFGTKTSFITVDFLKDFDYTEENIYLESKMHEYADANTAIYDEDVLDWFADNNACVRYVDEIINDELTEDDDISIVDITRNAMTRELYDALVFAYDETLRECMVADYLMKSGYTSIESEILNHMTANLKRFDCITFKEMFNNALNECGYDTYTCGAKS